MVTQRDPSSLPVPLRYDKGYRDEDENTVSKWFCPLESSLSRYRKYSLQQSCTQRPAFQDTRAERVPGSPVAFDRG